MPTGSPATGDTDGPGDEAESTGDDETGTTGDGPTGATPTGDGPEADPDPDPDAEADEGADAVDEDEDVAAERAERRAAENPAAQDPSAWETGENPVYPGLPDTLSPEQRHLFEETAINGIPVVQPPSGPAAGAASPSDTTGSQSLPVSDYAPPEGTEPPGGAESPSDTTGSYPLPVSDYAPPPGTREHEWAREAEREAGGENHENTAATPAVGLPMHTTPPGGVPIARLTPGAPGSRPWQERMRVLLRTPMSERPAYERTVRERAAEGAAASGPSVPRVLDVTLRIGELLLASGESAEDVEAAMLGVSHAFGLDRCEPTVTFTLLSISYHPSLVETPVTAERVVRRRGSDYTRLAAIYQLVDDITSESATVEEAYRRLADIRRNRHPYPTWMLAGASGLLAGSASVLVGGEWLVFAISFVAATLGDRLAWLLAERGFPEFYQYVLAAMPSAAMAAGLAVFQHGLGHGIQASAVITGGLFTLIPGRPLVAAVQDGLTGFYITAAARLLEVLYLFIAIVCGIAAMLYLVVHLWHIELARVDTAPAPHIRPGIQILAAAGLTVAFCILMQSERSTLLWAVGNGVAGWVLYAVIGQGPYARLSSVVATGAAAVLVGLFGQLMARYERSSSLPYVIPALGPLLPGSALYYGLLAITKNHMNAGLLSISRAGALALALAVGVNLGGELARLFLPSVQAPGLPGKRRAAKRTRGF